MAYTGVYERTIFYNPVNKYSVISVKTSDRSIPEKARSAYRHRDNMIHFAAVGYELPRTDQVSMILDGEWKVGKNGVQLHVTQCEEVVPQTRKGIKGYLSSRLIKGIGGKTAELIVDRFGADTLNVLENEPERLLEIRGVSKAKLEEIIASYNESRALRDLMLLLAPFQITPTAATKIYDHFGARSVDILRDNPFELCQVSGFGFKRVDAIMRKNNWPLNSPMRIRGAVFAALESAKGDGGHLYLDAEQLHKEAMSLLNSMIPVPQMRVKSDDLDAVIDDMLLQGKIINSNGNYYLVKTFAQEDETARSIARLLCRPVERVDVQDLLTRVRRQLGVELSLRQTEAVHMVFRSDLSIITGSPGTGKTTVLKAVIEVFKLLKPSEKILLAAPTGRASRRMAESTGVNNASTLHSLLGLFGEDGGFRKGEEDMVNCFRYINRKALEFAKQEMEDNDVKPSAEGYGTDVPDGLCYQWAEEYFKDLNAKEDRGQEEKFVPRPYYGGRSSTTKKAEKKKAEKPAAKKKEKAAKTAAENEPLDDQLSFDSLGVSA